MVSLETPVCDFGTPAVEFALPGVDGEIWTLEKCRGEKGVLVMFICNQRITANGNDGCSTWHGDTTSFL